jgi:hypothetical protein
MALVAQLMTHSVQAGSLREGQNFFSSTFERFPDVFKDNNIYQQELIKAIKRSRFVKDLGFDENQSKFYLFEGPDSLGRTWQFTFKVNQGDMTLDGKFISATPASFSPYPPLVSPRPLLYDMNLDMNLAEQSREGWEELTSRITEMAKAEYVVVTGHVYRYLSDRSLSEYDLFHVLKTGKVKESVGVDNFGASRYIWVGDDTTGNPFRLIIALSEKVFILSAASKAHDHGD